MVLTVSSVISPAIGSFATVACSALTANLTPASRRQDHTSSPSASAPFVKSASASTAARSNVRDDGQRPSLGTGWRGYRTDLRFRKTRIFLQKGLDRHPGKQRIDLPVGLSDRWGGVIFFNLTDGEAAAAWDGIRLALPHDGADQLEKMPCVMFWPLFRP